MKKNDYVFLSVYANSEWKDMEQKYDYSVIHEKDFDKIKEEVSLQSIVTGKQIGRAHV